MMHEITANGVFVTEPSGLVWPSLTMDSTKTRGSGKGTRLARGSAPIAWCFPARAVLALLLQEAVEETACVPIWVVQRQRDRERGRRREREEVRGRKR